MESEEQESLGQLQRQFEGSTEKLLKRLDEVFEPKDKTFLDSLFETHIRLRHVFLNYFPQSSQFIKKQLLYSTLQHKPNIPNICGEKIPIIRLYIET